MKYRRSLNVQAQNPNPSLNPFSIYILSLPFKIFAMSETKSKPATTKQVTVKVNEQNPEPLDILAKSIIQVSDGFEKINSGKMKRDAIVILLQAAIGPTNITKRNINDVLDYVPKLKNLYTKG